jgi:hypothetical protein
MDHMVVGEIDHCGELDGFVNLGLCPRLVSEGFEFLRSPKQELRLVAEGLSVVVVFGHGSLLEDLAADHSMRECGDVEGSRVFELGIGRKKLVQNEDSVVFFRSDVFVMAKQRKFCGSASDSVELSFFRDKFPNNEDFH